jgi:hypothetical protein
MLKVIDRFTTRDGSWEPNGLPFSITKVATKYAGQIPGAGAAHHIFVHPPKDAGVVEFDTEDGMNNTRYAAPFAGGWVSFPMFQAYNPDNGERGAWLVRVDGEKVADGLGLPYGWHVSTFLVVEDAEPDVQVPPEGSAARFTLYRNGALVYDSEA